MFLQKATLKKNSAFVKFSCLRNGSLLGVLVYRLLTGFYQEVATELLDVEASSAYLSGVHQLSQTKC